MRRVCAILILAFTVFLPTMSASAQKRAAARDYFPLRVGDMWTYRTTPEPSRFTVKVVSEEKQPDGTTIYLLEKLTGLPDEQTGEPTGTRIQTWYSKASDWLSITQEAYPEHEGLQVKHAKAKLFLKIPLVAGANWTWTGVSTTLMSLTEASKVIGLETVTVPAGTFQAMKVEVKIAEGTGEVTRTFWYADGVGLVKSKSESGQIRYGYDLIDYNFKKATKATPTKPATAPRRRAG